MLVKLGQLRVADLDIILRTNNVPVVGNKQAKIDELTRILGCDEIERDDYDFDSNTVQSQPDGLYEFNVMPFGLLNAPMVFQEVIMDLLRQLEHQRNIISYVDEVIIPSKTVDEGLVILNEFLQAIRSAGLTLRPSKCSFLQSKVKFLGHLVTANGI